MTHPLTDEICQQIAEDNVDWNPDWPMLDPIEKTCMRDAYDMGREKGHDEMLSEVISWIKANSYKYVEEDPYNSLKLQDATKRNVDMMSKIHGDNTGYSNPYDEHDMRATYDMGREKGHDEMLSEVISWIKANSYKYVEEDPYTEDHEFNHSKFAAHLRKAMYPFPKEKN